MNFIIELLVVFAVGAAIGLVYQAARGRPLGMVLHLGVVFGLFTVFSYFVVVVGLDLLNVLPEPPRG